MATLQERIAANETRIKILSEQMRKLDGEVDSLSAWKEQTVGAAREAARWASIRLGLAGLVLTVANIVITHFLH